VKIAVTRGQRGNNLIDRVKYRPPLLQFFLDLFTSTGCTDGVSRQ